MVDDFSSLQQRMSATHAVVHVRATTKSGTQTYQLLVSRETKIREVLEEIGRRVIKDSSDRASDYALFIAGRQLRPRETLESLIIQGTLPEFRFSRSVANVGLIDEATRAQVVLEKLPAVLGRYQAGNEPDEYTVNLLDNTVSRRHARLSYQDGQYYLEHLSERNTLSVDGEPVERGSTRVLNFDNIIGLGASLRLRFVKR